MHKKNSYFKVKVSDKNNIALKNVKLNIKLKNDNKIKIYTIKTNSHGNAKLNTKNLKTGTHKVTITSADDNYTIEKTKSKIFVGKQYTSTIKFGQEGMLKNKDIIKLKVKYDNDKGKEVKVYFKKITKYTKITKAKFYLYNQKTKKMHIKTEYNKFKNGKWELPDKDYSFKYCIVKAKVYYISLKKTVIKSGLY